MMKDTIKFSNEDQVLSEKFRAAVIRDGIYSEENRERKAQMLRRHEIMNSKSKKWVMFDVEREGFKPETVEQMRNRASNISIAKKIINKRSQTYSGGVTRTVGEEKRNEAGEVIPSKEQMSLDLLYDLIDFNTHIRKTDRYREGFKNCLTGIVPVLDTYESGKAGKPLYRLAMRVLAPWKYDVIEDSQDSTIPAVVIISEFTDRISFTTFDNQLAGAEGRRNLGLMNFFSDGKDQVIADAPEDREQDQHQRRFIWWTAKYHFTTDMWGKIIPAISPANNLNPIQKLPWENFAGDQDGSFWARGGDDIFETDILVNKKLTDANFIQFVQGWGQLVIDAVNPPNKLVGGPDNAYIFPRQPGEAPASVFFATSNPPIENWLESIRMILALCLSTNGLSTRNIAAKLDVVSAPSAVSLMVENSELSPDTKDSQEYFRDKEPCLAEIATLWHSYYSKEGWLVEDFQEIEPISNPDVNVKFHEVRPPISEKESLEALEMRQKVGIATLVDLLRRDNPDLTLEEAQKKAEEIYAEKKRMSAFVVGAAQKEGKNGIKNGDNADGDEEQPSEGDPSGQRKAPGEPGVQEGGPDSEDQGDE